MPAMLKLNKRMKIIIILSVFLLIFCLAGYYVYIRTMQAFSGTFIDSVSFLILYIFLLSSFFIGKIIEAFSIGFVSDILVKIGSVGAGFFLYALLFVIFFDFLRLINYIIPFILLSLLLILRKQNLLLG